MTKMNEFLLKWKGFQYSTSVDLNTEYYHIRLRKNTSKLCKIILPGVNIVTNIYKWNC